MKKLLLAAAAMISMTGTANAATAFGVDELNNLVTFDTATPGALLSTVAITGTTAGFAALDFRPLNGVLYGLTADRVVYTIDTLSGVATAVSGVLAIAGTEFGFDFNPTIDRLRIVSNATPVGANDNYVFNPNDGSLTVATNLAYVAGDPNVGSDPDVVAAAYVSSEFGQSPATSPLYVFDTNLNVLARQGNSTGTLTTVGPSGVNLGTRVSFDIRGSDAFAMNGTSLYSVNLATGAFTLVGSTPTALFGLSLAAVPEPATWAMMIAGFGMVGASLRRRRFGPAMLTA